ncbi:ATPase/histidine kinase/DNA gyrase B/HSP90 domain protein [delta proteobacterium NaphS2]|nr:ATPase/histidine kinase/DNA gyrase B/HSP90 domain protein [delta proteobacterium NaphS2]
MDHLKKMDRSQKNAPVSTQISDTLLDIGYRGIIDLLPCYLSIQDRSMNILFANENFRKDFGEGVGMPCHRVYKGRDEICATCPVRESFKDKQIHLSEENVHLSDGELAQLIVYSVPVPDMLGNVQAVMEMSTNITRVKQLQKELTFLGQSIAVLSHDMKNMLEGVQGGSYVLEEGLKDGDIALATRGWDIVKRNIGEISNIAQDILYSCKKRDIERHEVPPGEIIRDAAALFREKAAAMGIALGCYSDPSLPSANLDPAGMRRVLSNLIWNALEACKQDKAKDTHNVMVRAVFHARACCAFEVEDDGIGMDEDQLDNIFEGFYSGKGSGGTGLGLFVADKIVREHSGKIEVLSAPGKGSTFRILLPMKQS